MMVAFADSGFDVRLRNIRAVGGVTIYDVLTDEQIGRAWELFQRAESGTFAKTLDREIISPAIDDINHRLGQQMVPRYVAYMIEYFFNEATR